MNVKTLKEKLINIPDNYLVVMADYKEVTTFNLDNKYANGAIILSDADVCCMCGVERDEEDSKNFLYQEDTDEYICEDCHIEWLNERYDKKMNELKSIVNEFLSLGISLENIIKELKD